MMDPITTVPTILLNDSINAGIQTTTYNPWTNQSPAHQVVEIIYLLLLTVIGSIGNLTVIFSIMLEKRVHSHGNMFVINLAFADLLVTGFVVPTVIANVLIPGNALGSVACTIAGYTVTVTCTCSLCNLTFIAINRYWAVVHSSTYITHFTKKRVYLMVAFTWVWSNLLSFPTLVGWGAIAFDPKMLLCSWDDTRSISFTIFITICAIFIPLCVISFCYWKLFLTVRSSGRWVRSLSVHSGVVNSEQNRRSMRKESNLLQTLATTVAFFCICWLPYGFTVLIDPRGIAPLPKKAFGWLGLSNSGVNFIIYGIMNPVFRRGYRNLYYFVFRCQRKSRLSSTALHGSHSDSLYRSNNPIRRKSNQSTPNLSQRNSLRANANIIIHRDSCASLQAQVCLYRSKIPQMVWSTTGLQGKWTKSNSDSLTSLQFPYLNKKNNSTGVPSPLAVSKPTRSPNTKNGVSSFNSSFQRKDKKQDQLIAAKEVRYKRNSLMLLQITDETEDMIASEHRRTRSEVPSEVEKPIIKKRSLSSGRDSGFQGSNFERSASDSGGSGHAEEKK